MRLVVVQVLSSYCSIQHINSARRPSPCQRKRVVDAGQTTRSGDCLQEFDVVGSCVVRPLLCEEAAGVRNVLKLRRCSVDGPETVAVRVANCLATVLLVEHSHITQIALTVAMLCCCGQGSSSGGEGTPGSL
jgi:hypothetical protein